MASGGEVVSNKQVLFKNFVEGFPKESDMVVKTSSISLKVEGSNAVVVKNLYLSCDPRMRFRMNSKYPHYVSFKPGSVSILSKHILDVYLV